MWAPWGSSHSSIECEFVCVFIRSPHTPMKGASQSVKQRLREHFFHTHAQSRHHCQLTHPFSRLPLACLVFNCRLSTSCRLKVLYLLYFPSNFEWKKKTWRKRVTFVGLNGKLGDAHSLSSPHPMRWDTHWTLTDWLTDWLSEWKSWCVCSMAWDRLWRWVNQT